MLSINAKIATMKSFVDVQREDIRIEEPPMIIAAENNEGI